MRIYLLRHGITPACTDKHTKKLFKNMSLSERGRQQIINICPKISTNICKIYTSPTLRTIESAQIVQSICSPDAEIVVDIRLKNKIDDENDSYLENILQLLNHLQTGFSQYKDYDILFVTHGRIIKMIYSIIEHQSIKKEIMDDLDIDYADLFVFYLEHDKFSFPHFTKIM